MTAVSRPTTSRAMRVTASGVEPYSAGLASSEGMRRLYLSQARSRVEFWRMTASIVKSICKGSEREPEVVWGGAQSHAQRANRRMSSFVHTNM